MEGKKKQTSIISGGGKSRSRFAALHSAEGETGGTKKDSVNDHDLVVESNNDGMIEEDLLVDKVDDEVIKEREKYGDKSINVNDCVLVKAPLRVNDENNKGKDTFGGNTAGGKGVAHRQGVNHGKQNRKHVDNKRRDTNQSHLAARGKVMLTEKILNL